MSTLLLLFFIYSIIGLFYEALTILVYEKKLDFNRGFLIGPYIPIYGIGAILMLQIEKLSTNIFTIFFLSFIICMSLEYITSCLMEKIFKARWWDYTDLKYNINGRVELGRLLSFAVMGVIVIKIFNPILLYVISFFPAYLLNIIVLTFTIIFLVDFFISLILSYYQSKKLDSISNCDKTIYFRNEIKKRILEFIKNI